MNDNRTRIEVLLNRIDDPRVRDQLRQAIDDATEHRPLGLVFEEHMPEAIRIPTARVRRGATVQYRDERDSHVWEVRRMHGGRASLIRSDDGGSAVRNEDVDIAELVVSRRLGDPVYPGLTPLGTIEREVGKPHHIVIEGENFHALQALAYTHKGTVDLIYIDPPYNTGAGDWIYNDRYVGDADSYRHSKWLSFMHRRLLLARELLSRTGAIIVAIGDDEIHRLRMLMDQVFEEQNFIANVVWQGGRKNDSRFVSNGADYMLVYGRDLDSMTKADLRWREPRGTTAEIATAAADAWRQASHDQREATKLMKQWIASLPDGHAAKMNNRFYDFDPDGRVYRKKDISWPGGGGPRYDVLHPVTRKPVQVPSRGWIYSTPERMQKDIDAGLIHWGVDHTEFINRKTYLDSSDAVVPVSVFEKKRTAASAHLANILGSRDFPFPKDVDVIARWVNIATASNPHAVVLDFFAGTGTTAEAVMRLNAGDGGHRQSIIVTNNELAETTAKKLAKAGIRRGSPEWEAEGVFEKVTRPRIETVVTGSRPDGSEFSEGFDENVAFFKLDYLDRDSVEAGAAFARVAELLWMKAGGIGPVITERSGTCASTDHYAICFDADRFTDFVEEVNTRETIKTAFIVAASEVTFGTVKRALREDVVAVHLYENYLSNFEINTGVAR